MGKKRKSFKGIFLKRWLVVSLVAAFIYVAGVTIFVNAIKEEKKELYYQGQSAMLGNILTIAAERDGEQFTSYAQFGLSMMADAYEMMSILYDTTTGEKIADCEERIFVVRSVGEEEGNSILVCNPGDIPGWEEYREETREWKEEGSYLKVYENHIRENPQDYIIYTDGTNFLPKTLKYEVLVIRGINEWIYDDDMTSLATTSFDMPKECPEGYVEEDTSQYRLNNLFLFGYSENSPYMNGLKCSDESYLILQEYYEKTQSGDKPEQIISDTFFSFTLLFENELRLDVNRVYSLITVAYYNVWDIYGNMLIGIAIVLLLFCSLLALLLAKLSYIRLKAGYDMEDYRRVLMNTMAHNIKSPLMSISGYAENLQDNVFSEKREYYAKAIIENVQYMNNMIESILDLSKTENGEVILNKETIVVEELLHKIIKQQELWIQKKGLLVTIEGSLTLEADAVLFKQALSNLLDNAVKYAVSESKICITLKDTEISLHNSCEEDLSGVVHTLCEPFRVSDASRSNRKGSGMGLSIVKSICKLHGFVLHVDFKDDIFEARICVKKR